MHTNLSPHLHTDECNLLIKELSECLGNNRFRKFLLVCDDLEVKVEQCLKKEIIAKRKLHNELAAKQIKEKLEKLRKMKD
ncbi:COX assembly mitochondrial protein 2 homolog isoform X2 [Lycorma delicatula]|uniref:COX assembly mitochondrial protein 2 homolog isoform X2 n=1 Tax=Lycorma delicatula TaxID=130591 RepID=UPI003F516F7B